ncbi:MAG: hypothetical protein DRR19_29275 [Candidatus Parabeggiatoa sp. nov. 1]|nr:MAG: hypothetical protein DRR19_29275 [Gammaproteobacteria bacterium]
MGIIKKYWTAITNYQLPEVIMRIFVISLMAAFLLTACEEQQPSESLADAKDDTALDHAGKHLDPKYVCPMHPEVVRDEPGSCPICGMYLVKKEVEPESQEDANKHLDTK